MEDFKQKLLKLVGWTYEEEIVLVDKLSGGEQAETGISRKWSAKDIIAHNSFWKLKRVQDLNDAINHRPPQIIENYNEINEKVFEENKNNSWDNIINYSYKAYQTLARAVSDASNEDLKNEQTQPWKPIVIYCCIHPVSHLDKYYINRSQRFYAINLWNAVSGYLEELPASPGIIGNVKYNLAGHYLSSGEDFMAARILRKALVLNPKLKERAGKDPGLSSLL